MTPPARMLTFGETMGLAVSARFGSFAHSPDAHIRIGGSETNVAIAMQRLGVSTTWIGRVGADTLGDLIRRELRAEGVDARISVDPTRPTGLMLKERRSPNDTRVSYFRSGSAASQLSADDLPLVDLAEFDLVHTTGITCALGPVPAAAVRAALARAREVGVTTSFDLNYRSALWSQESASAHYGEIVPLADVVFAGEDEARILLPEVEDAEELAHGLVGLGAKTAVVKRGEHGAVAFDGEQIVQVSAKTTTVVDTVGAGDAFVAGYLADWLAGAPLLERLTTATAVASAVCESAGDWEGAPTRADLASIGDAVSR